MDRVAERRRAVALALHYREAEGLSIAEIAARLGRSPATVKAYFYDPSDANKRPTDSPQERQFWALAGHARTSICKRLLGSRCDGTKPAFPTTRFCRIPAARPRAVRLLLWCLQHPGAWLARDASSSAVERSWARCALSALRRGVGVTPETPVAQAEQGSRDGSRTISTTDRATGSRLDRKCGLGVSFDLMIGRLALGHETAASVLAAFLLER